MKRKAMIITILVLLIGVIAGGAYLKYLEKMSVREKRYLAADDSVLMIGDQEYYRGMEVDYLVNKSNENTAIIVIDDKEYEISGSLLASNKADCVKEQELYVLRSVTLLKDPASFEIAGFSRKGEKAVVLGYDFLNEKGEVNSYLISNGKEEGYLSSRYLAKEYYETAYDSSIYGDVYYGRGGDPTAISYYPKEEVNFKDNRMPAEVKALYLNAESIGKIDEYLKVAKDSGINSFVVDIKDCYLDTQMAYDSEVTRKYAPSTSNIVNSSDDYQKAIKKLKDEGYYVIGRITAFKDDAFAYDHQDEAITVDGEYFVYGGVKWPSIYSRLMWEYDLALAKEAVIEMDFDEIQFDYVRLPEYVPENALLHNSYDETPLEALCNFLSYARDELHKLDTYLSVDVFGEISGSSTTDFSCFVSAYGQFWPAFSNIVDVISSMPYPDHFAGGSYGIKEPWANPGELMEQWAKATAIAQANSYDKALCRTWIAAQGSDRYDIYYGEEEIRSQIEALEKAGINDGYLTWNAASNLYLYNIYKPALR
ncbi:MAG: putative glycoside hydrolase [Erysipelotrichaceae bacterium]|nr:putative glycoside hydrolase [Erysipelotrichaceae bacterium]